MFHGAIDEVEVFLDGQGSWGIEKVTVGDSIDELLTYRNYDMSDMMTSYQSQLSEAVESKKISKGDSTEILERLNYYISNTPYLSD